MSKLFSKHSAPSEDSTLILKKSSVHPIRCENVDLDQVLSPFTSSIGDFPCKYLRLQLHTRSLQKVHVQPLIERIGQSYPNRKEDG
jgi:hypothetical protein